MEIAGKLVTLQCMKTRIAGGKITWQIKLMKQKKMFKFKFAPCISQSNLTIYIHRCIKLRGCVSYMIASVRFSLSSPNHKAIVI